MRSGWRGRAAIGLLVAACLMLSGCVGSSATPTGAPVGAPTPTSPPTSTALPAGVSVELRQLRSDVADRTAQVRVQNLSEHELVVDRVAVTDKRFDGPAVRERRSTISAGRAVDLRIALPPVACDAIPSAGQSRLTIDYSTPRGSFEAMVPLPDPPGFTGRLHERECLRMRLAGFVTLAWSSFEPSAHPAPGTLVLSVTPGSGATAGTARLADIQTTNLLQFDAAVPKPFPLNLDVTGDASAIEVRVPLYPLRCDAHAVAEDKRGTVFSLGASVSGGSGVIEVAASDRLRGMVLRWVADWCGFGPGASR